LRPNKRLKLTGARRLGNEFFFSAPQLKRDPLGGVPHYAASLGCLARFGRTRVIRRLDNHHQLLDNHQVVSPPSDRVSHSSSRRPLPDGGHAGEPDPEGSAVRVGSVSDRLGVSGYGRGVPLRRCVEANTQEMKRTPPNMRLKLAGESPAA